MIRIEQMFSIKELKKLLQKLPERRRLGADPMTFNLLAVAWEIHFPSKVELWTDPRPVPASITLLASAPSTAGPSRERH
jgi:hypothetical protein